MKCVKVKLSGRAKRESSFMMQLTVLVLCCYHVLLVSTVALGLTVKEEWQSWKAQHGKEFGSEEEEMLRLGIWMNNMAAIEEHNRQNHNFTLKMNHFGDLVSNCPYSFHY